MSNEPNAPAPDALREELVNSIISNSYGKVARGMAERMVDNILTKQMRFYSQFADPQLEADSVEQMQVVMDTMGIIEALIRQGAAMTEHMLPDDRAKWQRTAQRGRELVVRMGEMFS